MKKYNIVQHIRSIIFKLFICQCCPCSGKYEQKHIYIDFQCASVALYLEICIIFGLICPIIVPIIALGLYSNIITYNWILNDLDWTIFNGYNKNEFNSDNNDYNHIKWNILKQFPIFLLYLSTILSQILFTSFIMHDFNVVLIDVFIIIVCVIDIIFILIYFFKNIGERLSTKTKIIFSNITENHINITSIAN